MIKLERYEADTITVHSKYRVGMIVFDDYNVYEIVEVTDTGVVFDTGYKKTFEELDLYSYVPKSYDEVEQISKKVLSGDCSLSDFASVEDASGTELMTYDLNLYKTHETRLIETKTYVEAIRRMVIRISEEKLRETRDLLTNLSDQVSRIQKVVQTLELYIGIQEDIVQLQFGKRGTGKVHLLQGMLYMDEEVGDPSDGGISFENEDDFDTWLLQDSSYYHHPNYIFLVPYDRSVRILRVRRNTKDRGFKNPFIKAMFDQKDMQTYLLIRNGENIYKISTQINFGSKLFPDTDEFVKIIDNLDRFRGSVNEQIERHLQRYKRNMIILQGIVERTEIFAGIPYQNLLSDDPNKRSEVEFVYENDLRVEDGSESPLEFIERAKQISEGCRVLYCRTEFIPSEDKPYYFYNIYRRSIHGYPPTPSTGVYQLHQDKGEYDKGVFYIMTPIYVWGSDVSKRSARWRINQDWSCFVIDFDVVSYRNMEDLDRLLHDRRNRKQYMTILPYLLELRKLKNKEIEQERPFVQLIMRYSGVTDEDLIWDALYEWKTKNKWKRAISIDDTKALRMITKKVTQ